MFRKSLIIFAAVMLGLFFASSRVYSQDMHKKMMQDSTKSKSHKMMKSDKSKECNDECCSGSEKSGMKMDSTMHSGMKMDHSKMQHSGMKMKMDSTMHSEMKMDHSKMKHSEMGMDHSKMDMGSKSSKAAAENSTAKIWNKVCPVRGEDVDPEAPTVEYKGKTIGFCCPGCDEKFQKDPEKYMKNLSEDGSKFTGSK